VPRVERPGPAAGRLRRPFYGWGIVAAAFVTMAVVADARTAFSFFYDGDLLAALRKVRAVAGRTLRPAGPAARPAKSGA
jgi:hypothetical protein